LQLGREVPHLGTILIVGSQSADWAATEFTFWVFRAAKEAL
jgi:hypothetical protein